MQNDNICQFNNLRSSDLICEHLVYEKNNMQSKPTFTSQYIMGFITEGKCKIIQNNNTYSAKAGHAFFITKNSRFSIKGDDSLKYLYVAFYGRRADELTVRLGLTDGSCVFDLSENAPTITEFALNAINRSKNNTDLYCEAVLLYLLAHMEEKRSLANDLLSSIIKHINDSFTDPTFSLGEIASSLRYDAKYISFFFKKNMNVCFSQYLRDMRIRRSIFLMEQGITSVKNIAILSGFKDALYFSAVFKKEIGKSPSEYIQEINEIKS